jgi:hypothetical protein
MVLRRYIDHVNFSNTPTKEIAELLRSPVRLANLLLRPCFESPVPCHTEMRRYLVEAYPVMDDVEGRSLRFALMGCLVQLNKGLVLDLIIEAISNTESQMLSGAVDLITQDARSNFFMKLGSGFVSSLLV